jgi:hypothetical protein
MTIHTSRSPGSPQTARPSLFLERTDVRPFQGWGSCRVVACLRLAYNSAGFCLLHSQRWNETLRENVDVDLVDWRRRQDGVIQPGAANLRGLLRLVVLEFLGGLQLRCGQGRKTRASQLNRLARVARHEQVATLADVGSAELGDDLKTVLAMLLLEVDRATITAGEEQRKDRWDLAVLGSTGSIDFTVLTQPWLREIAKHGASEDLARPGGCAPGLPGEFGVRPEDIPPPIHVDGPGRALPNEVMNVLNDALPQLEARSGRDARVAVEILMDTGRRPDQICQLPLDGLERDGDGKYVLIYTDYKENRLHRRLPIPDSTANLVLDQQAAVRAAFPEDELAAARAANRELMALLNTRA